MVSNRPGTLSMANIPWTAHSGSSQFFINMANNKLYDFWTKHGGRPNPEPHVVFGQVPKKRERPISLPIPLPFVTRSSPVCHTLIDPSHSHSTRPSPPPPHQIVEGYPVAVAINQVETEGDEVPTHPNRPKTPVVVSSVSIEGLLGQGKACPADVRNTRGRRLAGIVASQDEASEWFASWREELACWFDHLPVLTQQKVATCLGALGLHLGARFDAVLGRAQGAQPAQPGCEFIGEGAKELNGLPDFPERPHFEFRHVFTKSSPSPHQVFTKSSPSLTRMQEPSHHLGSSCCVSHTAPIRVHRA